MRAFRCFSIRPIWTMTTFDRSDFYLPERETQPLTETIATSEPATELPTETVQPSGFSDAELAAMQEVDQALANMIQSDVYAGMSEDERAVDVQQLLIALAKNGLVEEGSISYGSGMVNFRYSCGVMGGVRVRDFNPMEN